MVTVHYIAYERNAPSCDPLRMILDEGPRYYIWKLFLRRQRNGACFLEWLVKVVYVEFCVINE